MSIAANRLHGVRAATTTSVKGAKLSREHNDANILALGSRLISPLLAKRIVQAWLSTHASHDPRHERRVKALDAV